MVIYLGSEIKTSIIMCFLYFLYNGYASAAYDGVEGMFEIEYFSNELIINLF